MSEDRRIYKYEADESGGYVVPFKNAKPVLVAHVYPNVFPTLWCEVDVQKGSGGGVTAFHCVGTGFQLIPGDVHVGSAVCGQLVWHVVSSDYQPLSNGDGS